MSKLETPNNVSYLDMHFSSKDIVLETTLLPGATELVPRYKLKVILQEKDVKNNNRRRYSEAVLKSIVQQLAPKALERKLLAEMDHPTFEGGTDVEKLSRTATILISKACLLFTDIRWDGQFIVAEAETLSNKNGRDLCALLRDGVTIGFSLRAIGGTEELPDGSLAVSEHIKAITFDVVTNPSHANAGIKELVCLTESTSIYDLIQGAETIKKHNILMESDMCNKLVDKFVSTGKQQILFENELFTLDGDNSQILLENSNMPSGETSIAVDVTDILLETSLSSEKTLFKKFNPVFT